MLCRNEIYKQVRNKKIKAFKKRQLPLLHQQEMHRNVSDDNECRTEDGEADHILPQCQIVKAKCT